MSARRLPVRSSTILESTADRLAPGHCSVVTGPDGVDRIAYHAIDPDDRWNRGERFVRRKFYIDRLSWHDGWPIVERARTDTRVLDT